MTEGFFPLTIKKLVRETADATTIYFEVPENLKDTFSYSAGQYLTFEVEIAGEKVRRSYSLCTYAGVDADPAVIVVANVCRAKWVVRFWRMLQMVAISFKYAFIF